MLDKYIKINEKQIVCGQTSSGIWYCKELPANTTQELKLLIGDVNIILNKYNSKDKTTEESRYDIDIIATGMPKCKKK